jgi:hypothetical protein
MSKDTEIPLLLSSALALAGLGVSVGSQFQITPWVLLCWSGAGLLLIVWLQRHGPASATRHPARVFLIGTLLLSVGLVLAWWLLPKPLSVMGLITEWRNQEDRPSMQVLRQYRYLSARFTLSKSGDWSGRAYVEVSDSNVDDIKRYVPARLRIRQNWNG